MVYTQMFLSHLREQACTGRPSTCQFKLLGFLQSYLWACVIQRMSPSFSVHISYLFRLSWIHVSHLYILTSKSHQSQSHQNLHLNLQKKLEQDMSRWRRGGSWNLLQTSSKLCWPLDTGVSDPMYGCHMSELLMVCFRFKPTLGLLVALSMTVCCLWLG